MKRSNFLKSLLIGIVAPKVVVEVAKSIPDTPVVASVSHNISNFHLFVPEYLPKLLEKYGSVEYKWWELPNPYQETEYFIEPLNTI